MLAQVADYLDYVHSLTEAERDRFLSRKAPWAQRIEFHWLLVRVRLRKLLSENGGKPYLSNGGPFEAPESMARAA